jgi:hypothetical protein
MGSQPAWKMDAGNDYADPIKNPTCHGPLKLADRGQLLPGAIVHHFQTVASV